MDFSIVFPAYNEANTLENAVTKLMKTLEGFTRSYEIIIAEDGSTDGTDKVAALLSERYPLVKHLHIEERLGRGAALKNAFKKAFGMAAQEVSKFRRAKFMVAHAHAPKKAGWVVSQLAHIFQIKDEVQIVEAAPVLGVHAGPGTVGFGFIGYHD